MNVTPRRLLTAALAALVMGATHAETIDLSTPEGATLANRKVQCSTVDGKPVFYMWSGTAWGRRAGEADKMLFRVTGMNVRTCGTLEDPVRGTGWRQVSREIMVYQDPRTGEIVDEWENPYTGKTVKVLHVENDPVNGRPNYPRNAEGEPAGRFWGQPSGDQWLMNVTVPLFYHNVLQGDYQRYVGGAYHATEMFNFSGPLEDLTDGDRDTAQATVGWVRVAQWLPWMEMQGRDGTMYAHAIGRKLSGWDELPDILKTYIEERAPKYKEPPPVDDDRKNETSWTYFLKMVEGEELPRGGH
ncbi:MAG: DUF1838 family protein [Pseudomonadota bacterium]